MIADKEVISIYKDNTGFVLNVLSDEQAGQLFKAILSYGTSGEETEITDPLTSELFKTYARGMDRLDDQYEKRRQKNRENGRKGGRPKKAETQTKPKKSDGFLSETQKKPTSTSTNTSTSTSTNTSTNKPVDERDIALIFEDVWNVYPVQQSKDRTCREFVKQIQAGWDPDELLAAAVNYAEQCRINNVKEQYIIRPWNFYGSNQAFTDYINPDNVKEALNDGQQEYNLRSDFFG
jgi:hypothetical protein